LLILVSCFALCTDLDETISEQDADEDIRLLNFQLTELSEREEDDLLRLLDECEASGRSGLLDAESFYQRLQEEASRLDDASTASSSRSSPFMKAFQF
jgi:hypothetical protein